MSEVTFSDKYSPLFELLSSWEEVERLESIEDPTEEDIEDIEYFTTLSKVSVICLSGGRDSGKSYALLIALVLAVADHDHRVLLTRQTMTTTKNSVKEGMEKRMELLGRDDEFHYADHEFTLKNGESGKITITGQKTSSGTQTAKLKSIEDYSMFVTEEAEELESLDSWKKIKRSMRAKDVQCVSILCFNPPTREHWIADEFYTDVPDGFCGVKNGTLYIHTDYLDNGKENMAPQNWEEYEGLRLAHEEVENTPEDQRETLPAQLLKDHAEYKYAIKGGFKNKAEGVIYPYYEFGEFDHTLSSVGFGLDFGSNDPDALTKVAIDHKAKRIYIKEEYFKNNTSYEGLRDVLIDRVGYSGSVTGDCAERRLIKDLRRDGLNIRSCQKSMPVKDQIKIFADYTLVVCPHSVNLKKGFNNYRWHDKKAGVPNHDYSDIMDSWRYEAYDLINPKVGMF